MLFNPPWETKIGQLQQVTRTIQRNSDAVLDNRGAVIVRCYPYRSTTYMHLVYNLIYSTLASNAQFGSEQTPDEIRPILLNYNNGNCVGDPAKQSLSSTSATVVPQQSATFAGGVFHFGSHAQQAPQQQHQWTDFVLIRVHFRSHESALFFMQSFNRSVFRVFDRRQVRAPFCHADLTRPERLLRNYLQQVCDEKNSATNRQQQLYSRGRYYQPAPTPRFYHNGFHLYREFPNGRVELVPWEQFSFGQYLHVVVASLRKYAALYKQKQCYVIIQNVAEHTGNAEEDTERITSIVYSIVSTDEYHQRCNQIKQKLDQLTSPSSARNADGQTNSGSQLPQRIERLPRRGIGSSTSRSTTTTTPGGGEQRKGTTTSGAQTDKQQQKNTMTMMPEVGKQQQRGNGEQTEDSGAGGGEQQKCDESPKSTTTSTRPSLIRVQFRTREAAIAFCQLFKERQLLLRHKRQPKQQQGERSHGQTPDDDDVVIVKHQATDADGDADTEDEGQQTDSYSDLSDVFSASGERQDSLIIGAFAHRDLTPPELALGYALRQHCREKNIPNARVLLFPRGGRIVERPSATVC